MLVPSAPALILAPMEGVTDAAMRAAQGETGAFTFAVSEFLRVSHVVTPAHVFHRHVPELLTGARAPTGLPVQVQLLGGDASRMAASAAIAHAAGATAIDINFGCPAPTVNRHDGGATLLRYPCRIREIVRAVRAALPQEVPVSAKMRLGWDNVDSIFENATMAAEGGATWLTVHARTRTQGYAPPVFWGLIGRVREQLNIPIVANGDIWTIEGFRRCRDESGCRHFMLGRGALADPRLACAVAAELGLVPSTPEVDPDRRLDWSPPVQRFVAWSLACGQRPEQVVRRLKQWLKMAATAGTFAGFDRVKRTTRIDEIVSVIQSTI
jgi:tRNA-dihydrouridine synthase C